MLSLHGPRVGVFFESGLLIKAWYAHGGVCVCVCVCMRMCMLNSCAACVQVFIHVEPRAGSLSSVL